ncbi:MAG: tRNA pseudouridine(54/55) synthase Pus10 [Nitrosarchaeum sp.]|nr:tRNA pseudouridine(54/55) synthase Pus10 [Nitrosarchaeum sp.]
MTNFKKILPVAEEITKKHDLCDNCLGRLFSKQLHLNSNKLLGKKIRKHFKSSSTKCYVCKNLLSNLNPYLKLMLDSSSHFEYTTMLVGAMIKPSIIDRDDHIRSKYRLRGIDSIKTDITKELGKQFTRKTKKKIDFLDPEITFTINFKDDTCAVRSKSISLQGRYLKTQRGFAQKQKPCSNCSGKGCRMCNYHGISEFDSVEGKISEYLFSKFGGTTVKFTWVGGEDKSSLVMGSGRPFFAKIQNPFKRKVSIPKKIKIESVVILDCRLIPESPKNIPSFLSLVEIQVSAQNELDADKLKKLKKIVKNPVVIYDKSGKRTEKQISNLRYKKTSKDGFSLTILVEGGFPIKRFVESQDVNPSISQILDTCCFCTQFDFYDVILK